MLTNKTVKKNIIFLLDSNSIEVTFNVYENLINFFIKNKISIHFVNIEFLNKKKKSKHFLFKKILKFYPKNIFDLKAYLELHQGVIVKNYNDFFKFYPINLLIKKLNLNVIELSNLGDPRASAYSSFLKKDIFYIEKILFSHLPKKIAVLLTYFKIFKKISIRFESNYKIYKGFIANSKKFILFRKPTRYKKMINVKSIRFENKKNKITNKFITLLEFDPNYHLDTNIKLSKAKLENYYFKMNKLLKEVEKIFKKKVIICIHPLYNQKEIQRRYKSFKVIKNKTKEYILNSEIVMFFDSSSIIDAFFLNKKVIALKANIYHGKKNKSDLYSNAFNLHTLNVDKPTFFKKKIFNRILDKKIKGYYKYLSIYGSINSKNGKENILEEINNL